MTTTPAAAHLASSSQPTVIVGAGIAGLAAALRLSAKGAAVLVLESHDGPGGKMRTLPSPAGPVDAGPTVLTMRDVFEDLFAAAGERLEDHVTLLRLGCIARHFWSDGAQLDLFDDAGRNREALAAFGGARAVRQFERFGRRARALFEGFRAPMIEAAEPTLPQLVRYMMVRPRLAWRMAPHQSLARLLRGSFDDPRLGQLFGRYATYVGGSPNGVPALLSLIWHAEMLGVWAVKGGMHRLAQAIERCAVARGATFEYGADVAQIVAPNGQVEAVLLRDGRRVATRNVIFNGDPRALATATMGRDCATVAPQTRDIPRSLSAEAWAFAAVAKGPELSYHNVFFRDDPAPEFAALSSGATPVSDPTIYVCAIDRAEAGTTRALERFETIANAAPLPPDTQTMTLEPKDTARCRIRTFQTLARFGVSFTPMPEPAALTTPQGFNHLFPATAGSLYGQSPHGMLAPFQRPTARTPIRGLYLAGGGTHPGAGIPMATRSAKHAVEAMLSDQTSTSLSPQTATPGGMSTGSLTMAAAPSPSSGS
ncbi:MAG: 1-hydroxycarotenoid 3,4-desaturase CrtD [Pseudomonadota bacterium]